MMHRRLVLLPLFFAATPAAAEESAGLPQFDPTWYASQVFWLAVHFVVLYLLASKLVLPRIAAALARRQGKIQEDVSAAETMQEQSAGTSAAYAQALAHARLDAQAVREATAKAAAAEAQAAEQKLSAELAARAAEAEGKIAATRTALHRQVRQVAAEAAVEITRKLGLEADKSAIESALDRVAQTQLKEVA